MTVPTGHCSMLRSLFVGTLFEVTQDDNGAMPLRQPVDFLLNMSARSSGIAVSFHPAFSSATRCSASLRCFASRRAWLARRRRDGARARSNHAPRGSRPWHQHQERRLEGVRRLVLVAQHAASAPDQSRMPFDQRGERRLGSLAVAQGKPLEQLPIGDPDERAGVEERLQAARGRPGFGSLAQWKILVIGAPSDNKGAKGPRVPFFRGKERERSGRHRGWTTNTVMQRNKEKKEKRKEKRKKKEGQAL